MGPIIRSQIQQMALPQCSCFLILHHVTGGNSLWKALWHLDSSSAKRRQVPCGHWSRDSSAEPKNKDRTTCSEDLQKTSLARPFGRAGWWASGPLLSASLTWLSGIPVVWQDLPTLLRLGSGLTDPSSKLCFRHKYHFHHCMVTPSDQRKHRQTLAEAVLKIPTNPAILSEQLPGKTRGCTTLSTPQSWWDSDSMWQKSIKTSPFGECLWIWPLSLIITR